VVRMNPGRVLVALAMGTLLLLMPHSADAQEPGQAGLVIVKGDGEVISRCVSLGEGNQTGYDLLLASGLDFTSEQAAMGATICSIDGEGCAYPREGCWCRCQGSSCVYWSYWSLQDDGWRYSNLGAANQRVTDGDVQAWVWGEGTSGEAPEPPPASFAEICADPTQGETGDEATAVQGVAGQPPAAAAQSAGGAPTKPSAPTEATEGETGSGGSATWLWLAGFAVLPLLLLGLLRRRPARRPHPLHEEANDDESRL